jgi:hypothetical protein
VSLDDFVTVVCPYCGEPMEVGVEPDAGEAVARYEDCAVCCRPALVRFTRDDRGRWRVDVSRGHA